MDTNPASDRTPASARRSLWGGLALASGLLALLVAGAVISAPLVSGARGWLGRQAAGHWGGPHRIGHADPELARERAAHMVDFVLRGVDATDEQRTKATAIVTVLVDDLFTLRGRHQEHREAIVAELARDQIDRDALEQIRREGLTLVDEASADVVGAIAELAEVLTPDQRRELLAHARRFHRH